MLELLGQCRTSCAKVPHQQKSCMVLMTMRAPSQNQTATVMRELAVLLQSISIRCRRRCAEISTWFTPVSPTRATCCHSVRQSGKPLLHRKPMATIAMDSMIYYSIDMVGASRDGDATCVYMHLAESDGRECMPRARLSL